MARSARKTTALRSGRPPLASKTDVGARSTLVGKQSSKATRTLIRAHHNLHKQRIKALTEHNDNLVQEIDDQIQRLGGLDAYQKASLTGQSKDRGGDSSILLVTWLKELDLVPTASHKISHGGLRVLEVGALSGKNAISSLTGKGIETVRRIDLKSQDTDAIEEIDFMDLPVPDQNGEKFDLISLSLVLNYVPEPDQRGAMLKRTRLLLRDATDGTGRLPCLFFVLPLPCVSNSRYMTVEHLHGLMASLGYHCLRMHQSAKLHYELYQYKEATRKAAMIKKVEVNSGKGRNNFCITLTKD